jgi:hypothetical protein
MDNKHIENLCSYQGKKIHKKYDWLIQSTKQTMSKMEKLMGSKPKTEGNCRMGQEGPNQSLDSSSAKSR